MSHQNKGSNWLSRIWNFIKFISVISLIVGLIYVIVFRTSFFVVKDIEISCNSTDTKVLFDSFTKYFEGNNIFLVSMDEAIKELESNPFIAHVEIIRLYPNKIEYKVVMREIDATFHYNDLFLFLDSDGMLLRISNEPENYLVLEGFTVDSFVVGRKIELDNNDLLINSLKLINLVNQSEFIQKPVVYYENRQIVLKLNENFKVKFGNGEDIENKFNGFIDIYNDLQEKGIFSGVIDISHNGYPVFKPFGD